MRLTMQVPGAHDATVVLDGVEQRYCFDADDVAGKALCAVYGSDGKVIDTRLHRDWQEGEIEHERLVCRWMSGAVEFRFRTEQSRILATRFSAMIDDLIAISGSALSHDEALQMIIRAIA